MWYFGFDFIDTVLLLTRKTFALIGGSKKSINPLIKKSEYQFYIVTMMKTVLEHPEVKEYNIELIEKEAIGNT